MFLNSHLRMLIPATLGPVIGIDNQPVTFSKVTDMGIRVPDFIAFMNDSDVDVTLRFDAGNNKAQATGTVSGTYNVQNGTSDTVKVSIDGETAVTIDLTAGAARTPAQVVADINAALLAAGGSTALAKAIIHSTDKIAIVSGTTGTSSSVEIITVAANAYTILGLTVGVYNSTNSFVLDIVSPVTVKAKGKGIFNNPRPSAPMLRVRGVASVAVMIDATPLHGYSGVQQ